MTTTIENLAMQVRSLILEVDDLTYVFNEISEKYSGNYEDYENPNHPIGKLNKSLSEINKVKDSIVHILVNGNILDQSFSEQLKMLAMMDKLKYGDRYSQFVLFVEKHIKN
jgi:hypothetical protein